MGVDNNISAAKYKRIFRKYMFWTFPRQIIERMGFGPDNH